MKSVFLLVILTSLSFVNFGQEVPDTEGKTKIKEVGISFWGLDRFGLNYKFGKTNALWRFDGFTITGQSTEEQDRETDSLNSKMSRFSGGFNFGKEFRKSLTDNFELRYGPIVGYFYQYTEIEEHQFPTSYFRFTQTSQHSINAGFIFGFNYVAWNSLVIGAEMYLRFSYNFGYNKDRFEHPSSSNNLERSSDITGYSFGVDNRPVQLIIAYRF